MSNTPANDRTMHIIPRIYFRFKPAGTCFTIVRKQFPLRIAYCITINRAQGQEINQVLYDARDSPFSHGQCYVALSRVRHRQCIATFVQSTDDLINNEAVTINVCYPELLR